MADIKIKVKIEKAGDPKKVGDPEIWIYKITVRDAKGIWKETYGSKEIAEAFLRGLKAAFNFTKAGYIDIPGIPELVSR